MWKEAREYLGLSIKFAAKQAGMSVIRLNEIEHGRCEASEGELGRLSKLYGIQAGEPGRPVPDNYKEFLLGVPMQDRETARALIDLKVRLKERDA